MKGTDRFQFKSLGQGANWFLQSQANRTQNESTRKTYSVSIAAITDGGKATLIKKSNGFQWHFNEAPLDLTVVWQATLVKAKKEPQKWRNEWLINQRKYEVMNFLKFDFEGEWPYQLQLWHLP